MSTVTTYKCDRCGKEFENRKTMCIVSAHIGRSFAGVESSYKSYQSDWCHECAAAMGLPAESERFHEIKKTAPTLEEMIREIVREEATDAATR